MSGDQTPNIEVEVIDDPILGRIEVPVPQGKVSTRDLYMEIQKLKYAMTGQRISVWNRLHLHDAGITGVWALFLVLLGML